MKPVSTIRRARQKGSELVEASLVVVPLFAITFLLIDLSMVVYLRSTFQQAVREGVRYAITGQNTTGPCQDDSIKVDEPILQKQCFVRLNYQGLLGGP